MQRREISVPPTSSKKRKSTSEVWNHFRKDTDKDGKVWAICKHCGKLSSGSSKHGTTHLNNHLNSSKCKELQKEKTSSSETGGLERPTVTNGNLVFDEERSGLDLVRMIIKNGYPLSMVEHEDFKTFVKNLQPMFKLHSQDTLKDKIFCFYREEKEELRRQFDKVLSFSLILNFWTDCGKKCKYCSFTLQFIEDGPKLMKKNIAIKNVEYNYTGETLFEIVKDVLLDWNIDKKLATITVESSFANDQMVKSLDRWLGDQGNCHPFRKKIFHIRCITHVINLLVKDGLDEIDYILHKIRKAIKYMSETTTAKKRFEEVVNKLNLGGKDITSEGVPLMWDSTFFMIQIALEFRQGEAFFDPESNGCVFEDLSTEEWDKAEVMHKCLNIFYEGICKFLGSKCLSANVYFSMIFYIYGRLHQCQESDIVKKMKENFYSHFDNMGFVYAIVAVFDPRTKLDFVEYSFKQNYAYIPVHWRMLSESLDNMFNLYAENLTSQRSTSPFINNDNSSSSDGDDPFNILEGWKKSKRQRTELEKYLQEPLQPDEEFDMLGWWHTKSQYSPTLWTMARDILAIPMSTSTSKSAFCIETMTLDPIFNDLDPEIKQALFCGKDWLDNPMRITPNKDNAHSTANPEPTLQISGSTSRLEPLLTGDTSSVWPWTWAPQEEQAPSTEAVNLERTDLFQCLSESDLNIIEASEYVPSIAITGPAIHSSTEFLEPPPGIEMGLDRIPESASTSNFYYCSGPPEIYPFFDDSDLIKILEKWLGREEGLNNPGPPGPWGLPGPRGPPLPIDRRLRWIRPPLLWIRRENDFKIWLHCCGIILVLLLLRYSRYWLRAKLGLEQQF